MKVIQYLRHSCNSFLSEGTVLKKSTDNYLIAEGGVLCIKEMCPGAHILKRSGANR